MSVVRRKSHLLAERIEAWFAERSTFPLIAVDYEIAVGPVQMNGTIIQGCTLMLLTPSPLLGEGEMVASIPNGWAAWDNEQYLDEMLTLLFTGLVDRKVEKEKLTG